VTIDTELHVKTINFRDPVHFLYIPMTTTAIDLPVDMNGMIKKNKVGHVLNFQPIDRPVFIEVGPEIFYFRMVNDDPFMAKHACLKRRYA
jgi:hypothetical protein